MKPNLTVLRAAIAPLLTDACTVKRATGEHTFDEETGIETREYVTVYTGPVLMRPEGDVTLVNAGGATWPVRPLEITFPAESDVKINDVMTVTASSGDPGLVGAEIGINDVRRDSWQIAVFCNGRLAGTT